MNDYHASHKNWLHGGHALVLIINKNPKNILALKPCYNRFYRMRTPPMHIVLTMHGGRSLLLFKGYLRYKV